MQNHHFYRNECQRYRVCKSKSGNFAWEVLTKSLTFILTQKSKNLDFDDPCHKKNTSKGCLNPTLMRKTSPKPLQKPLQNLSKNLSKTYPKTSLFSTSQKLSFAYIYIAFWSNPPASRQAKPGLTLEREARLIFKC